MKFNLRKIKKMGKAQWGKEKQKAAVFLKLSEKFGAKGIMHQEMRISWYRHIDKALMGKATPSDAKHWKRMRKKFQKNIVGEPTEETREILDWLGIFERKVARGQISKDDLQRWLPRFKSYMQSCEEGAIDRYIIANEMMEG